MRIVLLIFSALLASCVQTQAFRGPGGGNAYSMRCGTNMSACYEKAGEMCPKGYTVIDRATGMAIMPAGGMIMGAPQHSLAVECK